MALPLGKFTLLLGAGLVGSVIAKEGRLPEVPFLLSAPFKFVFKQLTTNDSSTTTTSTAKKPHNDALLAQVNSLRQELQLLARDRTVTIVNASTTGSGKYVTVIVIVVVGYAYIWWKGWKLPNMMFATRRGLSDACTSIGNQLGKLYESMEDSKVKLSDRINCLDSSLNECAAISKNTREEISVIQQETDIISGDFKSVRVAFHVLESKIKEIEGKQVTTNEKVAILGQYALSLENSRATEPIQASPSGSSKPALELLPVTPASRAKKTCPSMPSSRESNGISEVINSNNISPAEEKTNGSSSGLFGMRFSGLHAPFLTRTRSATDAVVNHTRSRS
ncbi:hypothetical protein RIF29_22880 [Crotalaria pallida]|uniref:DUF1664 domain-containing protein n=1 Tax=Crotalaria pallida TaxID=3830 RepID=A0AAN9IES5_CROPI